MRFIFKRNNRTIECRNSCLYYLSSGNSQEVYINWYLKHEQIYGYFAIKNHIIGNWHPLTKLYTQIAHDGRDILLRKVAKYEFISLQLYTSLVLL